MLLLQHTRPRQAGALYATCTQLQAPGLCWHINCLEFLAVLLALQRFQPLVQGKHVLVWTDNTVILVYINCHGWICRVSQLAHPLLLWLKFDWSHCETQANSIAQQTCSHDEWGFEECGDTIPMWSIPLPTMVLPDQVSARHGCAGTQLAPEPMQICVPPVSLIPETLCKVREDGEHVLLIAPYWPSWTWFSELTLLYDDAKGTNDTFHLQNVLKHHDVYRQDK